jgi:phosphohistidine phosphatase
MDLILWRHADAQEPEGPTVDQDPPLTPKGDRQAHRMAQWLNHHLPDSVRVLVSPTLRAQQTAAALKRKVRIVPTLGPDGTVDALLLAARWPTSREPVLVVGDQVVLGTTAAYLVAGATSPWTVRKGAVWWLRRRERDESGEVIVQVVISPDRV